MVVKVYNSEERIKEFYFKSTTEAMNAINAGTIGSPVRKSNVQMVDNSIKHYCNGKSYKNSPEKWYGSEKAASTNYLKTVVTSGWVEKLDHFVNLVSSFKMHNPEIKHFRKKRKRTRGVLGHSLDIHQVYAGNVAKMWENHKPVFVKSGAAKNIKLVVYKTYNSEHSYKDIVWNGIAACVVASSLSSMGYNVEIDLVTYNQGLARGENICTAITLKQPNEKLSIKHLITTTCFPGWHRYAIFKLFPLLVGNKELDGGYGMPRHYVPTRLREKNCIEFSNIYSERDAIAAVNKVLGGKEYVVDTASHN